MIISLRLKNFYSLKEEAVLDFTADDSSKKKRVNLEENLMKFGNDRFIKVIGMFGGNASGKSNFIKALAFCRRLVLASHLNGKELWHEYSPFKFQEAFPSEFHIDFVTGGIEYEYSFEIMEGRILQESLYHFANRRKARVFSRDHTNQYMFGKGMFGRPTEVAASTAPDVLFLSQASAMNRPVAQEIYRFFHQELVIGLGHSDLSSLTRDQFERNRSLLLRAFCVSDSDIYDIRLVETVPGQTKLLSFHKENPSIPFDFEIEESEGTKRLLSILLSLFNLIESSGTLFLDEFDLKLHLRLAEFVIQAIRNASGVQLVFTSHNPLLIDTTKMRPEQIVFVTKESSGNSEFAPLSDYEDLPDSRRLLNAYLQGRLNAVPYIGDPDDIFTTNVAEP